MLDGARLARWAGWRWGRQLPWRTQRRHAGVAQPLLRVVPPTDGCIILAGVVGLHSLFTALHYPYYLTYFNPLAGGSLTAPWAMIIGWGEGLDQAAAWLNAQPDAEKLRIVSWYHDGPLSYFTQTEPVGVRYGSSLSWLENDFVVLYINQIQRDIPSAEAIDWYLAQEPALTGALWRLELARIYDMRGRRAAALCRPQHQQRRRLWRADPAAGARAGQGGGGRGRRNLCPALPAQPGANGHQLQHRPAAGRRRTAAN